MSMVIGTSSRRITADYILILKRSILLLGASFLAACALASPAFSAGFERTGDLNVAREAPMVVKLADGRVLVAGGATTGDVSTTTAEIYDPSNGTFTLTAGEMAVGRQLGAAVLLPSGKVLLVGGQAISTPLATAELFDPGTGTFTNVSSTMSAPRVWPLVTLLDSGKVLVSQGCCATASADIYDPDNGSTGTFTPTIGQPSQAYTNNSGTATKLANGKVLVAGDWNSGVAGRHAQIYDPADDSFANTAGSAVIERSLSMAVLLASGNVLIAGAVDAGQDTAEIFDPVTGLFTATPGNMSAARGGGYMARLLDGRVLVAGGGSAWGSTPNSSADIFDPATGTFTAAGTMSVARSQIAVVNPPVLTDGRVLFAGGHTSGGPTVISDLYVPDVPWPDAPTALVATAGNASASIAFTAGADNGAPITNYEYSTDGGTSWSLRSPVSTTSPIVISGLVNGTAYSVKLRGVNSAGSGAASQAVSVTPVAPIPTPASKPAKPAVTWSSSAKTKTVTAVITPVTGVTYRLTAKRGRVTKTGSCKNVTVKQGKKRVARRSCTIKLTKGKWLVSVTPKKGSVSGTVNRKSYSFK